MNWPDDPTRTADRYDLPIFDDTEAATADADRLDPAIRKARPVATCLATAPGGYVCTRPVGHDGNHVDGSRIDPDWPDPATLIEHRNDGTVALHKPAGFDAFHQCECGGIWFRTDVAFAKPATMPTAYTQLTCNNCDAAVEPPPT